MRTIFPNMNKAIDKELIERMAIIGYKEMYYCKSPSNDKKYPIWDNASSDTKWRWRRIARRILKCLKY